MREKGIGRQFLWAIYYRIRESSTVEIQQATKHKFSVEGNPGWSIHKKVCPLTFLVTIKLNSCLKLAQNSACHYCVLWLRCSQPLSLSRISRASCGPCDVLPMFPTLLCQSGIQEISPYSLAYSYWGLLGPSAGDSMTQDKQVNFMLYWTLCIKHKTFFFHF